MFVTVDYLWVLEASQLETALMLVNAEHVETQQLVCKAAATLRVEAKFLSIALALVALKSKNGK